MGDQHLSGGKPVTSKEQHQPSLCTGLDGGERGKSLALSELWGMGGNVFS